MIISITKQNLLKATVHYKVYDKETLKNIYCYDYKTAAAFESDKYPSEFHWDCLWILPNYFKSGYS